MNVRTFRSINRLLHLAGAALIGTFIYSPWGSDERFHLTMAAVAVPLLTITGLALWRPITGMRWLRIRTPRPKGDGGRS